MYPIEVLGEFGNEMKRGFRLYGFLEAAEVETYVLYLLSRLESFDIESMEGPGHLLQVYPLGDFRKSVR
jgi:hypothetical protein